MYLQRRFKNFKIFKLVRLHAMQDISYGGDSILWDDRTEGT